MKYYYNFINNLIFVSNLFKNSTVLVQNLMKINMTINLMSNLFGLILRTYFCENKI